MGRQSLVGSHFLYCGTTVISLWSFTYTWLYNNNNNKYYYYLLNITDIAHKVVINFVRDNYAPQNDDSPGNVYENDNNFWKCC